MEKRAATENEKEREREAKREYNFITDCNDNELNANGVNKMGKMFVFADNLHAQLHK